MVVFDSWTKTWGGTKYNVNLKINASEHSVWHYVSFKGILIHDNSWPKISVYAPHSHV